MPIPVSNPYFIAGAILFGFAGLVAYFWMSSFLFGAGYQGAPRRSVEAMFRLSGLGSQDFLFELGAGLGAVTFAAAREKSARVRAVEIEPLRYLVLRLRRALGPGADRIDIRRENMFAVDLREATVISAFLWPGAMARLGPRTGAIPTAPELTHASIRARRSGRADTAGFARLRGRAEGGK